QAQHGNPTGAAHHAGDMLNIKSDAQGIAQVDVTAAGTSLHGDPNSDILGKAIVVHEGPDDYTTQPSGNSGKRVACGVIAAPSPQYPAPRPAAVCAASRARTSCGSARYRAAPPSTRRSRRSASRPPTTQRPAAARTAAAAALCAISPSVGAHR